MSSAVLVRTTVALTTMAVALAAAPALAHALAYDRAHQFATQAGGVAVAVDRGTGAVYVAEPLIGMIERFDPAGDPLSPGPFGGGTYGGVAVDQDSHEIHVFDASLGLGTPNIATFDAAGTPSADPPIAVTSNPLPAFDFNQIAVDAAGDIYYPNAAADIVEKYSPAGALLESIGGGGALTDPSSVAVDSAGNLYVVDRVVNGGAPCDSPPCPDDVAAGRVQRFLAAGGSPATIDGANASSVAVDPATGNVLVGNGIGSSFEVVVYDPQGSELTSFGSGMFGSAGMFPGFSNEIAVSATRRVYVTDPGSAEVEMFDVLPEVVTGSALDVGRGRATLTGTVDPNGGALFGCRFEYGTTAAYGSSAPCDSLPGPGDGPAEAQVGIDDLAAGTTYHFRIVATNRGGTAAGSDATFTTTAPPPTPTAPGAPAPPPAAAPAGCVPNCGPKPVGKVVLSAKVKVKGGRARVKVRCNGPAGAACKGKLRLVARLGRGRRAKVRTIGRGSYELEAGGSVTVRVKLSKRARRAIARRGRLKARVVGRGHSSRVVTLTGAKTRKRLENVAR